MSSTDLTPIKGIVSMTKVKNQLKQHFPELVTTLHNERVNGQLFGCSGFITDPATDRTVYISTDINHGTNRQAMYRTAKDTKDYTGGSNNFCAFGEIVEHAVKLLQKS